MARVEPAGTWAAHLYGIFERNADRPLVTDVRTGESWTYGRFLEESRALASFLAREGTRPGDAVVFSMDNSVELAQLYFACMHVGARIVPINPSYHPRDYDAILERVCGNLFFTTPAVLGRIEPTLRRRPAVKIHCCQTAADGGKGEHAKLVNCDLAAARRLPAHPRTFAAAGDDDHLVTMFTSGTSAIPKGIKIRYGGILSNGTRFGELVGLRAGHRFYNVLSLSYLGGLYNLMLLPMLAQGSFLLDSVFGPTNVYGFWEYVREHRVTVLWFSPTMLAMLLDVADGEDLGYLKEQIAVGLVGMAPLPVDLKRRFEERFGFRLLENYGLSETTFITTAAPERPAKPGSVGRPLPGVEVRVFDQDARPLPVGSEGQIGVQTPYLMLGYDVPAGEDEMGPFAGDLFLTGDVGYLDADGDLFVTGRLKDIIIRGGVNIGPKMIEDAVYGMEAVQEAAVVGVPHPMYGEEVALVVKLRESARNRVTVEDVRKHCEATIAHFQRPKYIFSIDEMPKGATGKIQKNALKQMLASRIDPLNG